MRRMHQRRRSIRVRAGVRLAGRPLGPVPAVPVDWAHAQRRWPPRAARPELLGSRLRLRRAWPAPIR